MQKQYLKSIGSYKTVYEENIEKSKIKIDYSYQRSKKEEHIVNIAENFDPILTSRIKVSLRPDGYYYILDGQQTFFALVANKEKEIPCKVIEDLTIEDEASLFIAANEQRLGVPQQEKINARRIKKDKYQLLADKLLKEHGRGFYTGHKATTCKCVNKMRMWCEKAPDVIEAVFPLITKICENESLPQEIVGAFCYLEHHLRQLNKTETLVSKKWAPIVEKITLSDFIKYISSARIMKEQGAGGDKLWAEGLLYAINNTAPKFKRIHKDDRLLAKYYVQLEGKKEIFFFKSPTSSDNPEYIKKETKQIRSKNATL